MPAPEGKYAIIYKGPGTLNGADEYDDGRPDLGNGWLGWGPFKWGNAPTTLKVAQKRADSANAMHGSKGYRYTVWRVE